MNDAWDSSLAAADTTDTPAEPGLPEPAAGDLLARLVEALRREGVRYCRWKSRLDLGRVLAGEGDLDLLVDRHHVSRFRATAERVGFRRAVAGRTAPEDDLHLYGLDPAAGELIHLHVCVNLLGEDGPVSRSRLPGGTLLRSRPAGGTDHGPTLEEFALEHVSATEGPGPLRGMPVIRPEAERVVAVLCTAVDDAALSEWLLRPAAREAARAKLLGLLADGGPAASPELLERWLPWLPPALLEDCAGAFREGAPWRRRLRLGRKVRRQAGGWSAGQEIRGMLRRGAALSRAGWGRLVHGRGPRRHPAGGGAVIAFVGPEACGKSTLVTETTRWLGKAYRVRAVHLGKPPSTALTWLPNAARRLVGRLLPRVKAANGQASEDAGRPGRWSLLYGVRAVVLAWDRCALARRVARQAERGWLVVCDRYPSAQVGAADSARLDLGEGGATRGGLRGLLAGLESALYRRVPPPTLMIRLKAPLDVAVGRNEVRRKAGKESEEYVKRRHRAFVAPSFPGTPTVELDTNEPWPVTQRVLRQVVWRSV